MADIIGNVYDGVEIVGLVSVGGVGVSNIPSDTSPTTTADILSGRYAYIDGSKQMGTMPNNGSGSTSISSKTQQVRIEKGYYNGEGLIGIASSEQNKLVPLNIKNDVTILGVRGTYVGEAALSGTATPADVLETATISYQGEVVQGTMPNRGGRSGTLTSASQVYTLSEGYYDGTGTVKIDVEERNKLVPSNIRAGVMVLGVYGTLEAGSTPEAGAIDSPIIVDRPQSSTGTSPSLTVTGEGADRGVSFVPSVSHTGGLIETGTTTGDVIRIDARLIEDDITPVEITHSGNTGVAGYSVAHLAAADTDEPYAQVFTNLPVAPSIHKTKTITPKFKVNSAGFIEDGTLSGTAITLQARDFQTSGSTGDTWNTLDITANTPSGSPIDVEDYRYVNVNVSGGGGTHSPTISVSSAGRVTASCGGQSTYHDLSSSDDTDFTAANIKTGTNIFGVTGSFTSDANATAADLRSSKTAYVNGNKITGSMTEYTTTAANVTVTSKSGNSIPAGYYNGTPKAVIGSTDSSKLIATNIRKNVTILGVTGTLEEGSSTPLTPVTAISTENSKYIYGGMTVIGQKINGTVYSIDDSTMIVSKYAVTPDTLIYVDAWAYHTSDGQGAYLTFRTSTDAIISGQTRAAPINSTPSTTVAYEQKPISVPETAAYVYVAGSTASGRKAPAVYVGTPSGSGIDPSDATATSSDILTGKTAYIGGETQGNPTAGTMTNNGAVSATIDVRSGHTSYTVPAGYHNGSGTVSLQTETKSATPTEGSQTITPTSGKVLSSVTVNPIPSTYGNVSNATATAATILNGYKAVIKNANGEAELVTGTYSGGGGGGATVLSNITSGSTSSESPDTLLSLTNVPIGSYDIYASFLFRSTGTTTSTRTSGTGYVFVDGASPSGGSHTTESLRATDSGNPAPFVIKLSSQQVSNGSIQTKGSVSRATTGTLFCISLIAIKVG